MRRPLLAAALAVPVLLAMVLGHTTDAGWSASSTVPGTVLHTGTLDLRVDGQDGLTGWDALDVDALVPGQRVSSVVTVSNQGTARLRYDLQLSGSDADGRGLVDALALRVRGSGCGATLGGWPRSLAPGESEQVCVEVGLPDTAPASVADAATTVRVTARAVDGGWSDDVAMEGSRMTTPALTAPELSCGPAGLGSLTVRWRPVPGATAYRLHYGALGGLVETVSSGVLSHLFAGVTGVVRVEAVFGAGDWVSPPSQQLSYSTLLAGVLGLCS